MCPLHLVTRGRWLSAVADVTTGNLSKPDVENSKCTLIWLKFQLNYHESGWMKFLGHFKRAIYGRCFAVVHLSAVVLVMDWRRMEWVAHEMTRCARIFYTESTLAFILLPQSVH